MNKLKGLKSSLGSAAAKVKHAKELAAVDGVHQISGLQEYSDILDRRQRFVSCVALSCEKEDGGPSDVGMSVPNALDNEASAAKTFKDACVTFVAEVKAAGADPAKLTQGVANISKVYGNLGAKPYRLLKVLREFAWDNGTKAFVFTQEGGVTIAVAERMQSLSQKSWICLMSEFCFAQELELCLANRLPLPIADVTVHDVATFATIELDMVLVTTLDTEEEILHMKKCTEACAKKLADLIGTLAAAAKDLESFIEKNTTKAAERDEKAKQAAELKQHRALLREDEKNRRLQRPMQRNERNNKVELQLPRQTWASRCPSHPLSCNTLRKSKKSRHIQRKSFELLKMTCSKQRTANPM